MRKTASPDNSKNANGTRVCIQLDNFESSGLKSEDLKGVCLGEHGSSVNPVDIYCFPLCALAML